MINAGGWVLVVLGCVLGAAAAEVEVDDDEDRPHPPIERPEVLDERLELSLFAAEPRIATPIGLAVDEKDRLFVLESHTHGEPSDYDGPDGDRVKVFIDRDGDGTAEDVSLFAEGIENGMNLAFSPEGVLHVVTAEGVWALHDRDGDGRADDREKLVDLVEPDDVYDHAALMGIAFSRDGWMYISRGNVGGAAWRMVGTDGSAVSGFGDGGNIVRGRVDGSDLQEVATGFWNPFGLAFDAHGRLLATDNDSDSRGPNRLVHVVEGGDYGYKSLYGGSGIHPYLAWNGELPGTLPYAAALGEAPGGLLPAAYAALPSDYRGDVLVAIWEESMIVRVNISPRGVSIAGTAEPIVRGGERFRPVAMAADSKGTIYITDWALRQYPNHGGGRIWRLATRPGVETMEPRPLYAPARADPAGERMQELYAADGADDFPRLRRALRSDDPFVRHAAVTALARPVFRDSLERATRHADADVRLGALLALHRAGYDRDQVAPIARELLGDPDPRIRRRALIWAGRGGMTSVRSDLARAITTGSVSSDLFETYLATVEHLRLGFIEAYRRQDREASGELKLPPDFIASIIEDDSLPLVVRTTAIRHLRDPANHYDLLAHLAREAPVEARIEAVRSLAHVARDEAAGLLLSIARRRSLPAPLRAEALLSLGWQGGEEAGEVVELLNDPAPAVRFEAARYLRTAALDDSTRAAVGKVYDRAKEDPARESLAEQLAFVLDPAGAVSDESRPGSVEAWQQALATGGDPAAGRRVFYGQLSQCSQCHTIDHRGGDFGPDLTGVGRSKTRPQLVRAILDPSAETSPQWQAWYVRTADGQTHYGRQIDVGYDSVELYTPAGEFVRYEDVETYGIAEHSLMPAGLQRLLTVSDLRDLLAFLEQAK